MASSCSHESLLPPGWTAHNDSSTGLFYFYNSQTGVTQWEIPQAYSNIQQPPSTHYPQAHSSIQHTTKLKPLEHVPSTTSSASSFQAAPFDLALAARKLTKDYSALAQEYAQASQYRDLAGEQSCLLCHLQPSTHIFFPCGHKCVCPSCVVNNRLKESGKTTLDDGAGDWCFCPLCNEVCFREYARTRFISMASALFFSQC
jgi:hypothetical protein